MKKPNEHGENNEILELKNEIQQLKQQLQQLTQIKNNHLSFLGNSKDYIYFKNKDHQFTSVSQSFLELTGFSHLDEVIGKTDFDLFDKEHAEIYLKEQSQILNEGKTISGIEEPFYDCKGRLGWVSTSKWPIYDEAGEVVGLIGMSRDITHTKNMEKELTHKANFDHLTQVNNRESFINLTTEELQKLKHESDVAMIFFLDLDDFKQVNDQFGHEAGDFVLQTTTQRLSKLLRATDRLGRIGGDEFAIFSVVKQKEDHQLIAQRMIRMIAEPIEWNNCVLQVGCSVGIALFSEHATDFDTLLKQADTAMYQAKFSGKNRYSLWQPEQ